MTDSERMQIVELQAAGLGYRRIANILGLPMNSVKTFCRRNPEGKREKKKCLHCGKTLEQTPKKKEKRYCSDQCRMAWWAAHRGELKKKVFHQLVCQYCGKSFERYGKPHQKYCSRGCYDLARSKEEKHE